MRHKTYICIDDTDEIGYEKSTGEISEEIREYVIDNYYDASFVTRHQLFLHEDIPYTSHNSSMCFTTYLTDDEKDKLISFVEEYILKVCAPSSAPGIAICFEKDILDKKGLIEYALKAKKEVLTIREAFSEAKSRNIFLKALKENRAGVVGALAGVGLRLYGSDGRVKGKLKVEKDQLSVAEILKETLVEKVQLEDGTILEKQEIVKVNNYMKPVYLNWSYVLLVEKREQSYVVLEKEKLKNYWCLQ